MKFNNESQWINREESHYIPIAILISLFNLMEWYNSNIAINK